MDEEIFRTLLNGAKNNFLTPEELEHLSRPLTKTQGLELIGTLLSSARRGGFSKSILTSGELDLMKSKTYQNLGVSRKLIKHRWHHYFWK